MAFVSSAKMEWLYQRCHRESIFRSSTLVVFLVTLFTLMIYPTMRHLGFQLHSALTGSYVPGRHSVLLMSCPDEQIAKGVGRAIMEKKLAASVTILPKSSVMYYWKGDIQDATEIILLVQSRTSMVQKLTDFVKSIHPYDIPQVLSFPVEYGNVPYMNWMDDAVPGD